MGAAVSNMFRYCRFQVVILGLDNAGKSTIVYRLKMKHFVQQAPTVGFNCEKFRVTSGSAKGQSFTVWDIGGEERLRSLWKTYVRQTNILIYVVDSADPERFDEARIELGSLIRFADLPSDIPVCLLANKQDLPEARSCEEVKKVVGCVVGNRKLKVQPCCGVTGEGLDNFFADLYELITDSRSAFINIFVAPDSVS